MSFLLPWLVVTILLVAMAAGILYVLAVKRRSPQQWRKHVVSHAQSFSQTPLRFKESSVMTETVSLHDMLNARTEIGDAYYDPSSLPGYQRLASATDRIDQTVAERRSKEHTQ